ncbi:MAG: N-acetylmuramoyl-L-alanine amidase [Verrucomicrobiales bacterium]|nr:N-acetylmuramoyl-L-alanine amidase [Verrucomicrobiales bacterium]
MNRRGFVALLAAGLWTGVTRVGATPAVVRYQDRQYIRLSDWASWRGLRLSRSPGSREIVASGPNLRIAFLIDGTRVEYNGTGLWFSYPVLAVDGQVIAWAQDVRGVLDTLVQPPRLAPGKRIRTICLDAGHGGKEPGQKSGNRLEKQYTLALAQELRGRLVDAGFSVVMTRRSDAYVDLAERPAIAIRNSADLFVSLHYNASPDGGSDASGVEVYAMTPEGAKSTNVSADVGSLRAWAGNENDRENVLFAYHMQRSLLQRLPGTMDRGVRRARFLVLRLAEMPAILIEGGFMSNAGDARWIYSETGRGRMAQAIVDGIQAYKRQVERGSGSGAIQGNTSSTSSTSRSAPGSSKN